MATPAPRPLLRTRTIMLGAAVVLITTLGVGTALICCFPPRDAAAVLDIIRTAGSLGVGTGGAAALLLAARRQQTAEIAQADTRHNAVETRITELYGKAAEQLGSDQAPVRLAGVFALERLARTNPAHRQTIVDLLCAYLRMPFDPHTDEDDPSPEDDAHDAAVAQEREVRRSAQAVLTSHVRDNPDDPAEFWPDITLNLAGAVLDTFLFTRCRVRSAGFAGAHFVGPAVFRGSTFEQFADLRRARFSGLADFRRVTFSGEGANFRGAHFDGEVDFGTQTAVPLEGARTTARAGERRKWPTGWVESTVEESGFAMLQREEEVPRSATAGPIR